MSKSLSIDGFLAGLRPPDRLLPSEWADKHRYLSSKSSAEPGRWKTSRTPYLREPLDCFATQSDVQEVIFMKGAQIGVTEAGFNILGYFIDVDPGPLMYVMPTDSTMKRNTKLRFDPMVESSPTLKDKISEPRSRHGSNTLFQKDFPGGVVMFTGANSAAGLRSVPVRVLILDEVDAYPTDLEGEGSPVELAKARTRTFANKKIALISTPTDESVSFISSEFQASDQRYYHVPCPECGGMQRLRFENLVYDKSADPVKESKYECEHCGHHIAERYKGQMLAAGQWVPENPDQLDPKRRGYHLSSLYSPYGWFSWADAANQYEQAVRKHSNEKLKVFTNTVLGETWKQQVVTPKPQRLHERAGPYQSGRLPDQVSILTAGVDIQANRIEVEICGWASGMYSYSIDYKVLPGDTSQPDVWQDLSRLLYSKWERSDGTILGVSKMAVDSGYNTQDVYRWCRQHSASLVVPVKGQDGGKQTVMLRSPSVVDIRSDGRKVGNISLWTLSVDLIKSEIYSRLTLDLSSEGEAPIGYCYFPKDYPLEYYQQLCAERRVTTKNSRGFTVYVWEKLQPRNEALDCRVYARAAAGILGLDRWSERDWKAEHDKGYAPPVPRSHADLAEGKRIDKHPKPKRKKRKSTIWD